MLEGQVLVVKCVEVMTSIAQEKNAWLLHLIDNKAPPAARDSNEVACA